MTPDTDERVDRLYGLPLEEFTAERNALAAELRAAGDPGGATRVKSLRKPSAAAWAVNQLVRAEPDLVEALLGAGGELRQAHRQAASGKGAAQLRAAAEAERAAVEHLMARAPAVLGRVPSAAVADAMRNSLHAASSDDAARDLVRTGTLTTELRPVGLGPVPRTGAGERAEGGPRTAVSARRAAGVREAERARRHEAEEARRREAEQARQRELRAAESTEKALAREFDAATRAAERAEQGYARARAAADEAAARLKDAHRRLRQARAGLADAQRTRERLQR